MNSRTRSGVAIGATGGLVFVLMNSASQGAPWRLALGTAAAVLYAVVLLALVRPARSAEQEPRDIRFARGFWLVVVAEVVLGLGGLPVVVRVLDAPEAGVAWIALVVGLHFVALAALWRVHALAGVGAALALCGVAALALAGSGASEPTVAVVGGVLPGFLLLTASAAAVLDARARAPA